MTNWGQIPLHYCNLNLYVFPAVHASVDTNWITVDKGWNAFDLETYPLDVLTTGDSGRINIVMYTENETDKWVFGNILGWIKLFLESDKPTKIIVKGGTTIQVQLPDGNATRTWRIARTAAGFVITCNGIGLVNYTHPESYADQWNKYKVGQIRFWQKFEGTGHSDTLSQKFRGKIYRSL